MQEVWTDARRRIHVVLDEGKRICENTQIPHLVLLCALRCCCRAWSRMQCGDEKKCMVYQVEYPSQGNCKSVREALIMGDSLEGQSADREQATVVQEGDSVSTKTRLG